MMPAVDLFSVRHDATSEAFSLAGRLSNLDAPLRGSFIGWLVHQPPAPNGLGGSCRMLVRSFGVSITAGLKRSDRDESGRFSMYGTR